MFDLMFTVVPLLVVIGFVIAVASMIFKFANYTKNISAPRESVYAKVIAKRMDVRTHTHHHQTGDLMQETNSSRTYYYITLEFDNGVRREYLDTQGIYGLVREDDEGYAALQGDWMDR
ncbi:MULTISPECIES: DUF2500 domain-containing protein [Paenibacillus]|uniref:DUF2500 domain-containing protein n=1 Tax=Paenibacillus TaxID=44249 RepID=UPI0022B8A502|nr:DUF2500 domain-containing protein [Paenibacillus caseinilyticus]MCZ8522128.1 DUF2500 domain-containing protein [Paenibacillus caseinilyticus]